MKYFLGILLGILIIFLNFRILVFDYNFYEANSNKVSEINSSEYLGNLVNFLKDKEELNRYSFNEKEIMHLKDVKNLIYYFIYLFYFLFVLFFLLILKNYKYIFEIFIYAAIFVFLISLFLYFVNFNKLFYNFHVIFFNNNLWMLNPETDNLINFFSEEFFRKSLFTIIYQSIKIAFILLLAGLIKEREKIRSYLNKIIS